MELSLESVQTIRGPTLLKCTHFPEDSTWEFGGMNGFAQRKVRLSIFKSWVYSFLSGQGHRIRMNGHEMD